MACMTLGRVSQAQLVTYSFTAQSLSATSQATNIASSDFAVSDGTATGGTSNSSPVFSAGSGSYYFTSNHWTGTPENALTFTVTPNSGYEFSTTAIAFGYRATTTGPTSYTIKSSRDAFTATLGSGSLSNDDIWHDSGNISITLAGLSSATTFRIYALGASGLSGAFKVDDVLLSGSVNLTAVPEPSIFAAALGTVTLLGVALIRRFKHSHLA